MTRQPARSNPNDQFSPDPLAGTTVSHYRILKRLGGGGMGVVYQAEDIKLGRPVALKFLTERLSHHRESISRLRREARAASALNHPHICTIHDIDEHQDHPFIVMEFLEGETLRQRIAGKPLGTEQILEFGIQIAGALEAAHSKGIIHRDIKPANVFVAPSEQIKLLDFGLAKAAPAAMPAGSPARDAAPTLTDDPTLTGDGLAVGTVCYMSPEQARGEDLDRRTDLFSFGAVLYEMATGRMAFDGKAQALIFKSILTDTPPLPRSLNPSLPQQLEEIILKALEKDREVRYQSASEMRADLKRCRRDTDSAGAGRSSSGHAQPAAVSSRRWTWIAGAALAAAGLLAAVRTGWFAPVRQQVPAEPVTQQITFNPTEQPVFFAAISPDGKYIAYGDSSGIHLREVATGETHLLPVPEGFCFH